MTYQELEASLFARARHGMKLGLDRMERALAALGNPHRAAPAFHVAGTNGKGSVCAMIDAACRAAGLRCGLYTSPHLEHFSERFQVNGQEITEAELLALHAVLERDVPWALNEPDPLTFFEVVTLLAFLHFAREKVDVMVIEVGLGGRLDATNALTPMVTCITPIGLEHREYLGDTLTAIALEKAGILKSGVPAIVAAQEPEAGVAIARHALEIGAPLHQEGTAFALTRTGTGLSYRSERWKLDGLSLSLRGSHQRSNAAVALRALELASQAGVPVTAAAAQVGLASTRWPGRLETIAREPELVLDGAHNPAGARALATAIGELYPQRRIHLVLGVLGDKEAAPIIEALAPAATTIIATAPASPRALPAAELARALEAQGHRAEVREHAIEAVDLARSRAAKDDVVIVCGSLYLVGEVRAALRGTRAGGPSEQLAAGQTPR